MTVYRRKALRKKCPYLELFLSVFSRIRMRENTDQNNSEYIHFLRSEVYETSLLIFNDD